MKNCGGGVIGNFPAPLPPLPKEGACGSPLGGELSPQVTEEGHDCVRALPKEGA